MTVRVEIGAENNRADGICDGCSLVAPMDSYTIVAGQKRVCLCAECFETLREQHWHAVERQRRQK